MLGRLEVMGSHEEAFGVSDEGMDPGEEEMESMVGLFGWRLRRNYARYLQGEEPGAWRAIAADLRRDFPQGASDLEAIRREIMGRAEAAGLEEKNIATLIAPAEADAVARTGAVVLDAAELERAPTRQAFVALKTRDGRELKHHTLAVRGTAANPMTRVEVDEKCYDLMAPVLGKKRARSLIVKMWRIERVADTRALRPLLRA